jgi:SAM-dependent methyltransferase
MKALEGHQGEAVRDTYDRAAEAYARQFLDELAHKPLDCALLDVFAAELRGRDGVVVDLGTGPGQVARHLQARGLSVLGVDLSPGMIAQARALHPALRFREGSLLALGDPEETYLGATAFYAIVHFTPEEVLAALRELFRVLRPGAPALLAFHVGEEVVALTEFLGHAVALAWRFFPLETVTRLAQEAGFAVDLELRRRAYPREHPSTRGYLLLRKPERAPGEP